MTEKPFHHIAVGYLETNCWIYPLNENGNPAADGFAPCAVIDPGGEGDRIIALLDSLKLVPAYILLTHGHFDHIAAVPALIAEYRNRRRSNCEIAVHAADTGYLGPDSLPLHHRSFTAIGGDPAFIDALWEDMPPADRTLAEGDTVGPFTVLHLPGHTPGSVGFWDKGEGVLFSGDTLFCDGYGRTDLPGGNEAQLFASLKRLFALDVPSKDGGIRVFPGHDSPTTIERERNKD
jgi:glyoxylase-like metal-dependent hydrolase (beta-lactamase superfamily II)